MKQKQVLMTHQPATMSLMVLTVHNWLIAGMREKENIKNGQFDSHCHVEALNLTYCRWRSMVHQFQFAIRSRGYVKTKLLASIKLQLRFNFRAPLLSACLLCFRLRNLRIACVSTGLKVSQFLFWDDKNYKPKFHPNGSFKKSIKWKPFGEKTASDSGFLTFQGKSEISSRFIYELN